MFEKRYSELSSASVVWPLFAGGRSDVTIIVAELRLVREDKRPHYRCPPTASKQRLCRFCNTFGASIARHGSPHAVGAGT